MVLPHSQGSCIPQPGNQEGDCQQDAMHINTKSTQPHYSLSRFHCSTQVLKLL